MDTTKLIDALEDLRAKRSAIDEAIRSLESAVSIFTDDTQPSRKSHPDNDSTDHSSAQRRSSRKSNLEYALEVLEDVPQLHIEELTESVSQLAGIAISRASLDGGISREIREKNGSSRFERVSPGVYRVKRAGSVEPSETSQETTPDS